MVQWTLYLPFPAFIHSDFSYRVALPEKSRPSVRLVLSHAHLMCPINPRGLRILANVLVHIVQIQLAVSYPCNGDWVSSFGGSAWSVSIKLLS